MGLVRNMSEDILSGLIRLSIGVVSLIGLLWTFWSYFQGRFKEMRDLIENTQRDLDRHKLHTAEQYVSVQRLAKVEESMTKSIDNLTARIDDLIKTINKG